MINKISPEIFQLHFSSFGSCVYLLKLENKKILIDTSTKENRQELLQDLQKLKIKPEQINTIILTHKHWDHTGNLNLFPNSEVYSADNINKLPVKKIKVIKTPGHTHDSLSFLYDGILFSGDTLFHQGIGRTDLPDSQPEKMQNSLDKLKNLKYKVLCPGHID